MGRLLNGSHARPQEWGKPWLNLVKKWLKKLRVSNHPSACQRPAERLSGGRHLSERGEKRGISTKNGHWLKN